LQAVADDGSAGIAVQHEPKRVADKGAPDFKITKRGLILGYVENKAIGENLDKVLKSDQIKRYKSLSQNIILTDYLHFIWINKDGIQRETLCHATDLEVSKFKLHEDRVEAVSKLLQGFFSTAPEGIGRAQQLALALATRSKLLHDYLGEELVRQEREHQQGRLYGLFDVFRKQVFHELTLTEFADAFAQMLAYGLFLARLNSGSETVTLHNAREYVPGSFRLIQELVEFLTELTKDEYRDVRWVVEEVLSIVNALNLPAIHEDLSFRQRKAISRKVRAGDEEEHRLFERDPFIYFYEDFLKAYDAATRKARGVYYTPPPIVNFIVRAVDDILNESFGIRDGLADSKRVTVLDFACGTGTFLLEVFQQAFANIGGPDAGRADLIVREHFLKNIFGFEYLIAPYTIAHLKLSQYLKDQNHPLKSNERLQVFLTNTLEPVEPQAHLLLPAITAEVEAAQKVKDQEILVIVGNPPYSGISKNMGAAAQGLIERYKYVDGQHFGERKHWLQDDYVKFIAFAQRKMDAVEEGVVGIITNHSFLDNPTFRGMRQSLMKTFHQIYVLDLHGNAKKKEKAPEGGKDENVFDIEQGVSVSLFIRKEGLPVRVAHAELWGRRLDKYRACAETKFVDVQWRDLSPNAPYHFFVPRKEEGRGSYENGWPISSIFVENVTGIVTARDGMVIDTDLKMLQQRIAEFRDLSISDTEIRKKYKLKDTRGWKLPKARKKLANLSNHKEYFKNIVFSPFDIRHIFYHPDMVDWGRDSFMRHILPDNISIVTTRFTKDDWSALATDTLARHKAVSPEELFGFIYAVFYSPTYRKKYAEFLRTDFPRVPFPESSDDFETLSGLGWALVQVHLLRELPRHGLATYYGKGDHMVEAVRYSSEERAIWINKTQFFKPVPEAVWEFHIGGYQVLDKYLKSRKGHILSLDEINHVGSIADSLEFTIEQMAKIDKAYKTAFAQRG
jgi:predicted helicase